MVGLGEGGVKKWFGWQNFPIMKITFQFWPLGGYTGVYNRL